MVERLDPLGRRFAVGRAGPVRQVRPNELGERPFLQAAAGPSETSRNRVVHLDDSVRAVGHDDQIGERVERILEQASLEQHLLEELDVLDSCRELPTEVCRSIEARARVVRPRVGAFDDERPEGATPAA